MANTNWLQSLASLLIFAGNFGLMFLTTRYPIILFILGFIGTMIGLLIKILHWWGGSLITGSMIMVQGIALAWLIVVLLKRK